MTSVNNFKCFFQLWKYGASIVGAKYHICQGRKKGYHPTHLTGG